MMNKTPFLYNQEAMNSCRFWLYKSLKFIKCEELGSLVVVKLKENGMTFWVGSGGIQGNKVHKPFS